MYSLINKIHTCFVNNLIVRLPRKTLSDQSFKVWLLIKLSIRPDCNGLSENLYRHCLLVISGNQSTNDFRRNKPFIKTDINFSREFIAPVISAKRLARHP